MFLFDYTEKPLYVPEQRPWLPGVKPVQQELEIDWDHPLAEGLVGYFLLATGAVDIVGGYILSPSTGDTAYPFFVSHEGESQSALTSGGGFFLEEAGDNKYKITGDISVLWRGKVNVGSNFHHFAGNHLSNGGTDNPFDFRTDNDASTPKPVLSRSNASANSRYTADTGLSLLKNHTVLLTAKANPSSGGTAFIDGVESGVTYQSTAATSVTSTSSALRIGRRSDGGAQLRGSVSLFALYNRQLSSIEGERITKDPYQILKPRSRIWQVPRTPDPALSLDEPRWERPEMLIPGRKPTGPVKIDWDHWLARGVSNYVLFNSNDPYDLVTGRHLTVGGGPKYLPKFGSFFDEIDDYYTLPIKLNSEFSIVTHPQTNDNTGSNFQYILSFKSFGDLNSFQLYINEASAPSANALNIYGGSATNTQLASYYPSLTDKCLVFNSAGGTGQIFVDGIEQTTSPSTFTAIADNTSDTLYIASRSDLNVDRFFGGTLKYLIIYNQRTLSDPEVRQLSLDPYQFLIPA